MFEKLETLAARYRELEAQIADPSVLSRQEEWKKLTKEHADLAPIMEQYEAYRKYRREYEQADELMRAEKDEEMYRLYHAEVQDLREKMAACEEEMKVLLLPKDPNDEKNVVLEIRAGAGGEEAGLFGAELLRMYLKYAETRRWKTEEIDSNVTELGGIKEVSCLISGKGAYSRLKYESGVHRVQRVPETESQGRVHTSTVTVAVLPEAEDVEIEINENDLKIDTYRSSGAGGQHVNKTESAIRITHLPTGIVVACQDERSQIKNREKAMKVLKTKLYDFYASQAESAYAESRRLQVGTGDRSERIRTYNFPQGRVTDHRINLTLYALDRFLEGEIDEMIDALALADRNARLAGDGADRS